MEPGTQRCAVFSALTEVYCSLKQSFFKQRNKSVRVTRERLPATPDAQQPFSLKPVTRLYPVSGSQACQGKHKRCWTADAARHLDAGFSPYGSERALGSPEALFRNPAKTTDRSYHEICCRRLFSRTAHTRWSFTIGQAFRRIFCADLHRMRDPPDSRTRCLSSVLRVRTSQESGPRRASPCRPRCLSTNSPGSEIQCLRLGAWAGQTAPAPGAQAVSTTRIRINGNCVGERTQKCCKAACLPSVSLCCSCLRAFGASARESGDSGVPGKESTQFRPKHQKFGQSSTCVTSNTVDSLPARSVQAREPSGAEPPCRRQANLRKSTRKNGAAARGACSYRPPSGHERDIVLEALAELPDPSETTSARWPGLAAPEHQLSPTQPVVRRSDTGQTGHFTPLIILIVGPTTAQFPSKLGTRFLTSAIWQPGRRRCTFARMRLVELPRNFALNCNGRTSRSESGSSQ